MTWSVSQAKARLSEVIAKARRAPQVIESRGEEVAVVLSKAEYERLRSVEPQKTGIQKWLELTERLRAEGELNLELPSRAEDIELERQRPIPFADDE